MLNVTKWFISETPTLKNCICRDNALCRLCGRNSYKAFDDRKIILFKTYATELSAFHQIDTLSDTASTHSETLCRPCYMHLMRLKRSKVPSDFTLPAAKEDIDKLSSIWSEFNSLLSAGQCSVCAQTRGRKKCNGFRSRL